MKIIECPRDAMQGLHDFIPTTEKARYLNALLQVGFDTLDFGSFVSPKALSAASFPEVDVLGYPFSISETFQLRNTNATIEDSLERVKVIQDICLQHNKTLLIYISMGFGNPYGDYWNVDVVQKWVAQLAKLGITIFQLSDTIGVAEPANIEYLFKELIVANPTIAIGAHFHTTPDTWEEKIVAAYENGCRRFDGTIRPMLTIKPSFQNGCTTVKNK